MLGYNEPKAAVLCTFGIHCRTEFKILFLVSKMLNSLAPAHLYNHFSQVFGAEKGVRIFRDLCVAARNFVRLVKVKQNSLHYRPLY